MKNWPKAEHAPKTKINHQTSGFLRRKEPQAPASFRQTQRKLTRT